MASLCHHCGQPADDDARPLKVLPCGHTACVPCIGEEPAAEGRRCPVCGKIYKIDVNQLVTARTPEKHRVWCRDCDAVARAVCLDEHAVCGQGALRREAAAALAECRAGRADVLHALAEAARREEQLLRQEPEPSPAADLAALRAELAAARAHPLHGLQQGLQGQQEQPLAVDELLRRALAALRDAVQPKIEPQPTEEWAALDRQQQLGEREAALDVREAAILLNEKFVQDGLRQLEEKEVDLARRKAIFKHLQAEVKNKQRQLEEKEVDLARREAILKQSEAGAGVDEFIEKASCGEVVSSTQNKKRKATASSNESNAKAKLTMTSSQATENRKIRTRSSVRPGNPSTLYYGEVSCVEKSIPAQEEVDELEQQCPSSPPSSLKRRTEEEESSESKDPLAPDARYERCSICGDVFTGKAPWVAFFFHVKMHHPGTVLANRWKVKRNSCPRCGVRYAKSTRHAPRCTGAKRNRKLNVLPHDSPADGHLDKRHAPEAEPVAE